MNLSLIRSMTRSAVFELENGLCYRPAHPFTVTLNGKTIYEACQTNVFSLFSLLPGTEYTVGVQAEGESLTCTFTTEAETFFVDASRYGLVADGTTDNTLKLQAALSTCPKGGTVYVPAGRYRTCSLFLKSNTTLYLEKGAVLLGDNDRTHYPILPGVIPSENEVDEYYLTGWEGNPLDSFAGLLNITQVHDVVVTGEGTLDCDAENGDWWVTPKIKRIAWRPRAVAAVDSENICLHGITVQNSYSWTIHPIFVKHLDLLNFNINNPYNAPNTDGISFLPTLLGNKAGQKEHEYLYWEYPDPKIGNKAIRMGKWKGIITNIRQGNTEMQLYDLDADLREEHDVAAQHPDIVAKFRQLMEESSTPDPNRVGL